MKIYHNPFRSVRLHEVLGQPAETLSREDASAIALGFQRAFDKVTPPQMGYPARIHRAGDKNPAYDGGACTRERRNLERRLRDVHGRMLAWFAQHPWRPDAFHPKIKGRAVHLHMLWRAGIQKDGLIVSRTWQPAPLDRFKGVFIAPKSSLMLIRQLIVIARQLLSWLENLAVTGGATGAGTSRSTQQSNFRREALVKREANDEQQHRQKKDRMLEAFFDAHPDARPAR